MIPDWLESMPAAPAEEIPRMSLAPEWHCKPCEVGWRGEGVCWVCEAPGDPGPLSFRAVNPKSLDGRTTA